MRSGCVGLHGGCTSASVGQRQMEIRILGPLEVRDGERLLELGGGKQRALLAALAINRGEPPPPDRLIDDLGPASGAGLGLEHLVRNGRVDDATAACTSDLTPRGLHRLPTLGHLPATGPPSRPICGV